VTMHHSIIPKRWQTGRSFWGTHALWAAALEEWGRRNSKDGVSGPPPWGGIYFDKLAHVINLIWTRLASEGRVSFTSVYQTNDGIHGPGPAIPLRPPGSGFRFALKAIHEIQEEFSARNIDINLLRISHDTRKGSPQYYVRPGRPDSYFSIGTSPHLPPGFLGSDLKYRNAVSELLSLFTQEEIRALGTHQTEQGTIEAIEFNIFIYLARRTGAVLRVLRGVADQRVRDSAGGLGSDELQFSTLPGAVLEINRKCRDNEQAYVSAYRKLLGLDENQSKAVREVGELAGKLIFSPPREIWTEDVKRYSDFVLPLQALLLYVRGLAAMCGGREGKMVEGLLKARGSSGDAMKEGQEAAGLIRGSQGIDLPAYSERGGGDYDWGVLGDQTFKLFSSFSGSSPYWKAFIRSEPRWRS